MNINQSKSEAKCGKNEPCFEKGNCWGHLAPIMCKHLREEERDGSFICKKIGVKIQGNNIY
jgi:hypothetical protein